MFKVFAIMTVLLSLALGAVFYNSLPLWCATPDVGINYIVQPLCGK